MRIDQLLKDGHQPRFSFEFFPPKTDEGQRGLEGCGAAGPGDLFAADPRLGPLADNGGPTRTRALLPDSPAVDAGTDAGLKTDQRGVARSTPPDIGAFEVR